MTEGSPTTEYRNQYVPSSRTSPAIVRPLLEVPFQSPSADVAGERRRGGYVASSAATGRNQRGEEDTEKDDANPIPLHVHDCSTVAKLDMSH